MSEITMPLIEDEKSEFDNPREATPVDQYVGEQIEIQRRIVRMTQSQLASSIGMSDKQLRKYITGKNRVSAGTLAAIASALNVPVGHFFKGLEHPSRNSSKKTGTTVALEDISEEAAQLAKAYHAIPAAKRKALRQVINAIAAQYTKTAEN